MIELVADRIRLSEAEARTLSEGVIAGIGYSREEAETIADHFVDAALCGYEYSGLPKLLDAVEDGRRLKPRSPMRLVRETNVSALFDGGSNLGMLTLSCLADVMIAKASSHGFAVGGLMNSWMSGRSAYYVEKIARADLVAIHTVGSSLLLVAPPGGNEPVLGANPIAIGLPAGDEPIIFDMGTSAIMHSDISLRTRRGELLPEGVAIDANGMPTRDPVSARAGALLPLAGHKGFGLGFMCQAMGLLAGAGMDEAKNYGYLFVVFRPDLLVPLDEFKEGLAELISRVKAASRLPGVDEIRIPSERSFRERKRNRRDGIAVDRRIYDKLVVWTKSRK
jgi:LDH2 family malate/lactate/ureidoglycolate dehydrogenase